MIVLDGTIVTVALPTIQDDLGFSQTGLSWVVNAYLIGFGGLLLLAGRFADLFGRRRLFMAGIAIFTTASALLRRGPGAVDARRRTRGPGRRRRRHGGRRLRHRDLDLHGRAASAPGPSGSGASRRPAAARSACCSAAC